MNYTVEIDKVASTSEKFPVTRILNGDGAAVATLDVQSTAFCFRRLPNAIAADFLLIGAVVYALDKLASRSATHNAWTRLFKLTIPVSDVSIWRGATAELGRCVSFLTGDDWQFEFIQRERELFGRSSMAKIVPDVADIGAVSLFSGGMDSLAGVIDWFEAHPKEGLLLAGHHDKQMPGPLGDQESLLPALRKAYPSRIRSTLVRVGNTGDSPEITLRGRSLVFIAAAVCIASGNGFEGSLILPENGTIALNVPLSPSRRGSCSTRTAHPYYIEQLQAVFAKVGLKYSIENPLQNKTKGEVAATCANKALFAQLATASVSCAKRGHKRTWINRSAKGCGMCMPCIYRRAALHRAALDTEVYGRDVCTGEVDFNDTSTTGPGDLRACISFIQRNPKHDEVATLLLANGSLRLDQMGEYSDLVIRAFQEIRQLFRDKGDATLKRMAGILN